MQINSLKLKYTRKKRKTVGRGGKKGTYSGRGNKGQKARSGAHINPLFEGGRSTLVDRMKKARGFKSRQPKMFIIDLMRLEGKMDKGEIKKKTLIKAGIAGKMKEVAGIKIVGKGKVAKKFTIAKEIKLSASAKEAIEKAGGKIETGE